VGNLGGKKLTRFSKELNLLGKLSEFCSSPGHQIFLIYHLNIDLLSSYFEPI
jgi:hypothetical protein